MSIVPLWARVIAGAVLVVGVAAAALMLIPTGQVAYEPRSPVDLRTRATVDGRALAPLQGRIFVTRVEEEPVTWLRKLWLALRRDDVVDLVDASASTRFAAEKAGVDDAAMQRALRVANGLGFDAAGARVRWSGTNATIQEVLPGGAAEQAGLRAGDVILAVNGREVDNSVDATRLIARAAPGARLRLQIRRAGTGLTVSLAASPASTDDAARADAAASIGAVLDTIGLQAQLPRKVDLRLDGIAGLSAGLPVALFAYEIASEDDLLQGRSIAAAGRLRLDGTIEEIPRVRQRAIAVQRAGIDLLLVPAANADAARRSVAHACDERVRCTRVIGVDSLAEAIRTLLDTDAPSRRS